MYKVTVVIPTYNSEKTLTVAIDSVLNQTYSSIECLLIDGASNDGTLDIIKGYANHVKHISEPDSGIYNAYNKGIKLASGDWVLFLGSDDSLELNGIEKLMEYAFIADVIYGHTTIIKPSGYRKKQYGVDASILPIHSAGNHQSTIMKKSVLLALNGFDEKFPLLADYDLVLRAYLANYTFKLVDAFISNFYQGGTSAFKMSAPGERLQVHRKNKSMRNPFLYFLKDYTKFYLSKQRSIFLGR